MDTTPICPSCGKPLAPDAPQGLCQECLLKAGFPTGTDPGGKSARFVPPAIEELTGKFSQLEILEFIGQGGMGAVYKARQKQLNRLVALKILPPGIGNDPAFAERFTREAQVLAQLNHPGIVTLYEFGQVNGLFYFLMEFVDGVNLRQLLRKGRVSAREALAIVPQICDALQFAHDQGLVHRDIKPENILLDRRGRVKVADFGLAKLVGAGPEPTAGRETAGSSPALTESGRIMGTPSYMAPEQVEHPTEVDHRADIYALGVVFYQMLTGELPGKKIVPPSNRVQIDVRLDEVVLRALEKEPDRRYQQVSEVKTGVETISHTKPSPKSKVSMKKITVLSAIIAVLGIALVYEIVQTHRMSRALVPIKAQQARADRQKALRGRFENRMTQDQGKYTAAQLREAENLMRIGDEKWGTPEANESCQELVKQYPDSDRAGCAMLYLAQWSHGDERARYLQDCIEKYNDCFYGDGVQVGAYARYLLAEDYKSQGETAKAESLFDEIKAKYPDAIDHRGNLLVDSIKANPK